MTQFIETKVSHEKQFENGKIKNVCTPYLVDAMSFTEAESRIIEEVSPYMTGEFTVSAVRKTNIAEVFDKFEGDKWYNVKVEYITIDDKTGAEKRAPNLYLILAYDFINAYNNFIVAMKNTMADYDIVSISETKIMDVFKYKAEK